METNGVFVDLDNYYRSITFLETGQLPRKPPRYLVPLKLDGRQMALPRTTRHVVQYDAGPNDDEESWDAED